MGARQSGRKRQSELPSPNSTSMAEYSFTTDVSVRYQDRDAMGHVNNAVYATYLEEARIDYFETVLDAPLREIDAVLANLELEFHRPVERADEVTVAVRVPEVGESSLPVEYEVRANGEVVATGETVLVVVDEATKSSKPIPEAWREAIRDFEGL